MFGHQHWQLPLAPETLHTSDVATYSYNMSTPSVKLMYPEPYVATASTLHYDLWFVHILLYQYWL